MKILVKHNSETNKREWLLSMTDKEIASLGLYILLSIFSQNKDESLELARLSLLAMQNQENIDMIFNKAEQLIPGIEDMKPIFYARAEEIGKL